MGSPLSRVHEISQSYGRSAQNHTGALPKGIEAKEVRTIETWMQNLHNSVGHRHITRAVELL